MTDLIDALTEELAETPTPLLRRSATPPTCPASHWAVITCSTPKRYPARGRESEAARFAGFPRPSRSAHLVNLDPRGTGP